LKSLSWGSFSVIFIFGALTTGIAVGLRPFGPSVLASASAALLAFAVATGLALVLRLLNFRVVAGAFVGLLAGWVLGAVFLASLFLARVNLVDISNYSTFSFFRLALPLLLGYIGLLIGASNSSDLAGFVDAGQSPPSPRVASNQVGKLLDTSVLIDGRITDVVECGFLEGPLVIPRFVLHELQAVADSADAARRARGRRGLDVVQQLQGFPDLKVEVTNQDFPNTREVDLKLIELARLNSAKIVTNDFNLNKLAQVQGIEVLNINQLASSLKPIVLPGEMMRVFVLKEGKEHNQGIAYLDDGTMVVVDNARRHISKNIDIVVTSVLQTTAGKMIFGRHDERVHAETRPISASASS
jgi:uncharacterized protein YacL